MKGEGKCIYVELLGIYYRYVKNNNNNKHDTEKKNIYIFVCVQILPNILGKLILEQFLQKIILPTNFVFNP